MKVKGTFVSIWDGDVEVRTPAVLDTNTGEIITESVEANIVEILEHEYFELEDSNVQFEVCPVCHNHIRFK